MQKGLLPIKFKDYRTYDFHRTFGIAITPLEFNFDTIGTMPDQNADGYPNGCTAYAQTDVASNEDKIDYNDKQFTYNKSLAIDNLPPNSPVGFLTSLKACTVYGVKNTSMTGEDALNNRRAPYFIVRATTDKFDGLVSAMWVKQGGISVGTPWLPQFETVGSDGIINASVDSNMDFTVGHNWVAYGVKVINGSPRIICKSWQGLNYGDKGYCYFSREQINALLSIKGSGAFGQKHASPEDIQTVKMNVIQVALSFMQRLLYALFSKVQSQPIPIADVPKKYLWETPDVARHSIRVICDEEGLSVAEKNLLCQVINCESGFHQFAKNENKDKDGKVLSTDFGICQWNDYWHGKEISPDEAMNNPEKAVRLMIEYFKKGRLNQWVCYSSGKFNSYKA